MSSAWRIPRDPQAFSNAPIGKQKKRPREEDGTHLKWLRTLPCVITGARPVEAAHIRYGERRYGKVEGAMGAKPDDRWALPLHPNMHRDQHDFGDERLWWEKQKIDPLIVAMALYQVSGDDDQALLIMQEARNAAKAY